MFTSFMPQALEQAYLAQELNEVPVGAVIIHKNKIIAAGHNLVRTQNDPTAHAEIIVIRQAAQILGNYRLQECDLYVTLEPCTMCAGAIAQARIKRLYYGAEDIKGGAVSSGVRFFHQKTCHHKIEIYSGIMQNECKKIIYEFFL